MRLKEKVNVLIVDDRLENLISLKALLEDEELNIICANSGQEALSHLLDNDFSLVLMDVQMPEMDGFETAKLMRGMKKTRNIPIIFVTAISKEEKFIFKGYEVGAIDYIYKPIDSVILKSKIKVFVELYKQKKLFQLQAIELQRKVDELEKTKRELEEVNRVLEHLSSHDGLTGIPNRRSFDEVLNREWKRAIRNEEKISIMLIDIDFFKNFNDIHGHIMGDSALRLVAKTISKSVKRPGDFVARYGGEEFIVILPNTDSNGAFELGELIRKNIEQVGIINEGSKISGVLTISVGIGTDEPNQGSKLEKILEEADFALYESKKNGRNMTSLYAHEKSRIHEVDFIENEKTV